MAAPFPSPRGVTSPPPLLPVRSIRGPGRASWPAEPRCGRGLSAGSGRRATLLRLPISSLGGDRRPAQSAPECPRQASEVPEMSLVRYETDGALAVITLDHPPVNALSTEVIADLAEATTRAAYPGVRAVVVPGSASNWAERYARSKPCPSR